MADRTLDQVIADMQLISDVNAHYREENADVLRYLCEYKVYQRDREVIEQIREDAIRQRDAHIAALRKIKADRWISVKDRLPEIDGTYLCSCRYRDGSTAQKLKLYRSDMGFTSEPKQVTHWRPLPPDPEEA